MALVLPGMRQGQQLGAQPDRIRPARTVAPIGPDLKAALDRNFQSSPYTREIMAKSLGKEMSLAQTIDGYTLTVARVYADSKYVFIGLVAEGPEGRAVADIHLDDITYDGSQSDDLAWGQEEVAVATLAGDPDRRLERGPTQMDEQGLGKAFMLGFVTPELEPGTKRLDLRLELAGLVAREAAGGRSPSSVGYGGGCEEINPRIRCRLVRGPFEFDLTVPVEPTAPEYYDPKVEQALGEVRSNFLHAWVRYANAKDRATARRYEREARAYLTPTFEASVRDLGALPIPNVTFPDGDPRTAGIFSETDSLTQTRASMPTRWWVDGELVIRRFHFERADGEWRISEIEPLSKDPQPWIMDP
jgi:hypothetical protein